MGMRPTPSLVAWLVTLTGATLAWLAPGPAAALQIETIPYALPPYEVAAERTYVETFAEGAEYEAARGDDRFTFRKIAYPSDGLRVVAYYYGPADPGAPPRPTVIFNRGNIVRGDIAPEVLTLFHRLADGGYTVLAPMYRGSDGGEGRDEYGGDDLNDLFNVLDVARTLPAVDMERLFLYGESRGATMVFLALREGFPARAAAVTGSVGDFDAFVQRDPEAYRAQLVQIWPDYDERYEEIVERRSPARWIEEIDVPVLLMHGGRDQAVDPGQSRLLAERMEEAGIPHDLKVFEDSGHLILVDQVARDRAAMEWFGRWTRGR